MDVIPIISDGFNVYFPMMIVALCLATYYNLGSRLLSALGFQQFIGDDELTTDLIEEGRTIASRGKFGSFTTLSSTCTLPYIHLFIFLAG